jgi:Leucine-rich repeat (LRR) protein
MSALRSPNTDIVESDMGKVASKMLQMSRQGEDMRMDIEVRQQQDGVNEVDDAIFEHGKKKMKVMVDGEGFAKVKAVPRRVPRRKQAKQQTVFTEGQEEDEEATYKHKQPSLSLEACEGKVDVQTEENAKGDVEDGDYIENAEGDSECSPVPQLPVEILSSVCDYLRLEDRCAVSMVCKYWNMSAWYCVSTMEFNMRHRPEQESIIAKILKKCVNVRHVTLRDCFNVSGRIVRQLPNSVQSFQFFNCPVLAKTLTNDDMKSLPEDLMSLSLKNCEHLGDDGIAKLPGSLKVLELTGSRITDAGLCTLPRELKSLTLSRSQSAFKSLAGLPATLVSLDLSNCALEEDAFAEIPKFLKHLTLSGCVTVSDTHLLHLSAVSELKTLVLENSEHVTVKGIEALPCEMKSLSLKNCAGINDKAVAAIPRSLTEFTLWKCVNVTKLGLTKLPSTLVSLKLVHTAVNDECVGMLPDSLSHLSLFGSSQITDVALQVLPKSLRELDLSWSPVTDKALQHLTYLEKLTKVNLANSKVSREGVIVLENNRPGLTILKGYCD